MKTLILSIFFFLIAGYFNQQLSKPAIKISKQASALNIDHRILKLFTLGQDRLISDFLWISTLLESDLSHYKNKDLNSWMFLRFNSIAEMDPLFLQNYQFGGQYLSIIKDDLKGAEIIFNKGIKFYPEDYSLNLNSAFLYAFELQNYKEAVIRYETLIKNKNAPAFVKNIINKLRYESTGDLNLAFKLVNETYKNTIDKVLRKKLKQDLYAIQATIDLKCLNRPFQESCNQADLNGLPYVKRNSQWFSQTEYKAYRIYNNKKGR